VRHLNFSFSTISSSNNLAFRTFEPTYPNDADKYCTFPATLKGHHGPVWTIDYSPDGKVIATGSEDGTIKLWKNTKEPYGLWKN